MEDIDGKNNEDDKENNVERETRKRAKKARATLGGAEEEEDASEVEEREEDHERDEVYEDHSRDEHDDDDDIEVDVVEGSSRMARRGSLKSEARTLDHLLTHRYKIPYCELCVRAKMVTYDFVDTQRILDQGVYIEREIFLVRYRYTGMVWAYPTMGKEVKDIVASIKHFAGLKKIRIAYGDKAPEFEKAMKETTELKANPFFSFFVQVL